MTNWKMSFPTFLVKVTLDSKVTVIAVMAALCVIPMKYSTTVVQTTVNILPVTAVSIKWYVHQTRLAKHNLTRHHQAHTVETGDGLICYVNKSDVQGTLEKKCC